MQLDDAEMPYKVIVQFVLTRHTAENMDKWTQVATIGSQYCVSEKPTHSLKLILIVTG